MDSEKDQARLMAERIARRVSHNSPAQKSLEPSTLVEELHEMRASLGELQSRLSRIESQIRSTPVAKSLSGAVPQVHSPWLSGVNSELNHPSQERFGVEEAAVSELVDFFQNEKTCALEPGGKPCDHCSMCSSRGF